MKNTTQQPLKRTNPIHRLGNSIRLIINVLTETIVLIAYASSQGSDVHVQMHSIYKAFAAPTHKVGT